MKYGTKTQSGESCKIIEWNEQPKNEHNSTQHHVDSNGEEIGQLQVVIHQTPKSFITVATIVHNSIVEVTLKNTKYVISHSKIYFYFFEDLLKL